MADPQQLAILQQGVEAWNTWKKAHPQTRADLREANLSKANLSKADLSKANFRGANLSEANLSEANLRGVILSEAALFGAILSEAALSGANLLGANLLGANLNEANLNEADLSRADLFRANLNEANLNEANLNEANLNEANLSKANLSKADLFGANLFEASLNEANLSGADLSGADLTRADLSGADLSRAHLVRTDLSGAILTTTDMTDAEVGGTHFTDLDLRTVKGLETFVHWEPSHISITTFYRSEGQIPDSFLRKAGVPEDFLVYLSSLVNRAIEYYTCFISYSSKDQEFVERLYTDLQSKGVRCWFAPEDLKTGDKIRDRIDQSIRIHDKLLLVLSQHSVNSSWVEFEVEAAIAKENSKNALMLFPIRLDSAVKDSPTSWAAHIRRTRNITDFSKWKQHDVYQNVLNRLLRDLKPETPPATKQE